MTHIAQILPEALAVRTSPVTTAKPASSWHPKFALGCPVDHSLAEAARLAGQFVADVAAGAPPYWLTFTGVPGCGKTFLARQIFEAAKPYNPGNPSLRISGSGYFDERRRRPGCVWLTATQFADRLRAKEYDLPEYLAADFIVVLDDLGAARDTTAFIAEAVYRLCNERLGRWTLFTSNLSATAIAEQIDPRVASRLIRDGNKAHRITAPDFALRRH